MWDAGEFIAAVHTFGIPHQPGTPLYILLARAWSLAAAVRGHRARDESLLGRVHGRGGRRARGCSSRARRRSTRDGGSRARSARAGCSPCGRTRRRPRCTRASLLLVMLALLAAERAGRTGDARGGALLTAYRSRSRCRSTERAGRGAGGDRARRASARTERCDWTSRARGSRAVVLVRCGSRAREVVAAVRGRLGVVAIAVARGCAKQRAHARGRRETLATFALRARSRSPRSRCSWCARDSIRGSTRARPPRSRALWDVVGRRQYDVARTAGRDRRRSGCRSRTGSSTRTGRSRSALSNGVAPIWRRTPITVAFALLGVPARAWHRRAHARSWRALVVLFVCATRGAHRLSELQGRRVVRLGCAPRQRAARGARPRLLLRARLLGVGRVGRDRRGRARASASARSGRRSACSPRRCRSRSTARAAESAARARARRSRRADRARAARVRAAERRALRRRRQRLLSRCGTRRRSKGMRPDVTVVVAPLLGAQWYRARARAAHVPRHASGRSQPERGCGDDARGRSQRRARERIARVAASLMTRAPTLATQLGALTVARGLVFVERVERDRRRRVSVATRRASTPSATVDARRSRLPAAAYDPRRRSIRRPKLPRLPPMPVAISRYRARRDRGWHLLIRL